MTWPIPEKKEEPKPTERKFVMRKLGQVIFIGETPKMLKFEIVIGDKKQEKNIYIWQSDFDSFTEGNRKTINFYYLEEEVEA